MENCFGRPITKEDMKLLEGLYPFVARFLYSGTHASNYVYGLLKMGPDHRWT